LNRPITVDDAVVLTVRVVVWLGVIEAEASKQVPPVIVEGTEQLKLTVPVKPLRGVMLIVVVPEAPGDEIENEVGLATTLKSAAPLVMVTMVDEGVVEAE
jgi:hypothetical protein